MAFLAFLELLETGGNVYSSVVIRHRKSLQSFLMGVKGLGSEEEEPADEEKSKRSFRKARLLCLPKGYCAGAAGGVAGPSGFIGISANAFLFIAEGLDLANTRKMLLAHNLYTENRTYPLDPSSTCNGCPAVGSLPGLKCVTPIELQRIYVVGKRTGEDHAFLGYGVCLCCPSAFTLAKRLVCLKWTRREPCPPVNRCA
jgi:hypothetical protein